MSNYNKTIIIGHLGRDPRYKISQNNVELVDFSLCCSTRNKAGEQLPQWHRISVFGKQANLCHRYLKKGDLCCVEGKIHIQYYDRNGERRSYHSIWAEHVTFLGKRREDAVQGVETEEIREQMQTADVQAEELLI